MWRSVRPMIKRLYIFNAREMNLDYAKKLPNIENVYIYCLTSLPDDYDGEDNGRDSPPMKLCLETAKKAVPFLEAFPQLEFVHMGGYTPRKQKVAPDGTHLDLPYTNACCSTEGHQKAFRAMLQSFCDAFGRKSLDAKKIRLSGLLESPCLDKFKQLDCNQECNLCSQICKTFPLSLVASVSYSCDSFCTPGALRLLDVFLRDPSIVRTSDILAAFYGQRRCLWGPDEHSPSLENILVMLSGMFLTDPNFLRQSDILKVFLGRHTVSTINVALPPIRLAEEGCYSLRERMKPGISFEYEMLIVMKFLCKACECDASAVSPEFLKECFPQGTGLFVPCLDSMPPRSRKNLQCPDQCLIFSLTLDFNLLNLITCLSSQMVESTIGELRDKW